MNWKEITFIVSVLVFWIALMVFITFWVLDNNKLYNVAVDSCNDKGMDFYSFNTEIYKCLDDGIVKIYKYEKVKS